MHTKRGGEELLRLPLDLVHRMEEVEQRAFGGRLLCQHPVQIWPQQLAEHPAPAQPSQLCSVECSDTPSGACLPRIMHA